jgi:uncharacterized membrane protein YhaH (DUF805 family)
MLMPLRRYAEFSGRSRRMEFWMWKLFTFLASAAIGLILMVVGGAAGLSVFFGNPDAAAGAGGAMLIMLLLYLLFALAIFIPDLAVTVRRLHDTDRSGWWILAPAAPYTVAIAALLASEGEMSGTTGAIAGLCGLVAIVLAIALLVFMFVEGTRGPNRFGPDPKAGDRH